ncbi:PHP domain-containing protein [Chloroflexota bacterium]
MSQVDLHIHSTASDGKFSPEEIIAKAAALGLTTIALADHDSVEGIAPALEAARAFPRLRVIPSIELSTDLPDGEAHVLGYFLDYTSGVLISALERFRDSRRGRAQGMVDKLRDLGIRIDWQRVQEIAGDGSIGRPHIARAMLEKGFISSFGEAFTRFIGRGGPAYVDRYKMTPAEAVALIVQSNGLPVLAHPFTVTDPEATIIVLKEAGLVGIEAYYNHYSAEEIRRLVNLADKHNLIPTGGSDYHGLDNGSETMMGAVEVPISSAEKLIALAGERASEPVN